MTKSSKSPENVSWIALGLSLVFFGVTFFVGHWSQYFAITIVSWQVLAGVLVWFVLALQFRLRGLAEREKLDMTSLTREGDAATIFHAGGERAELMAVAQRRLSFFEKWFLPLFSLLIALYQLALGWALLRLVLKGGEALTQQPLVAAIVMTAVAFFSFLLSRYATGMSLQGSWKPLRAGGSLLLATAVLCFALAIGLACAQFQSFVVIQVLQWVIPCLMLALGVETALNVVFDVYRPRIRGQYSRAAFDSRILGVVNEPGGILHSAASAMDYQFGFKVSQTWFYRLMEKAIVPLILFSGLTLYLLSCIVVVSANEQAVIERFGNPMRADETPRLIKPGLTLKFPWPIDKVYKWSTEQVEELYIGYVPKIDEETGRPKRGEPLLWGKEHHDEEFMVLVASETQGEASSEGALPISLVNANVPVHYKVKDLYSYLYKHREPKALLEAICYREMTRYVASAKVEVDEGDDASQQMSLLGAGRTATRDELIKRIQQAADREELGVDIVFLGLQGVHPPPKVVEDYQKVIGAVQSKQALILNAQAERNKNLSNLAGSVAEAQALYELARQYQTAREGSANDSQAIGVKLDQAFTKAQGRIYEILRRAQADALAKVAEVRGDGLRFSGQVKAYDAAPEIYLRDQRINALMEAFPRIRKYAIATKPIDDQVVTIDLQEKLMPSLYDMANIPSDEENN